jgi:peptide/nickel transport system substrate-binding protein
MTLRTAVPIRRARDASTRSGRPRVALLVAVALLLTACGQGSDPEQGAAGGGRLSVGVGFVPDAGYAIDTDDAFFLTRVGMAETLVRAGVDGVAKPGLALSWEQVDPVTWEFALRPDVRFQDGAAFDAAAVVTAVDYVTGVPSPPRSVAGAGLGAVAVDDLTVKITTAAPDPVLPLRMSTPNLGMLSPAAYQATPPAVLGTGTGPFTIVEINAGSGVRLVRHQGYWGPIAQLAEAEIRFLPDAAARTTALVAGDVDIAQNVPPTSLAELQAADGISADQVTTPRVTSMYTSLADGPLADERVREALELAVDRPALVASVLEGTGQPAREVFGEAVAWGATEQPPGADPAAARALLQQAGYGPDQPLSLRLWAYPERPELPDLATAISGMLEQAGVQTTIRIAEYGTLEPDVLAGNYDLLLLSRSYLTDFPDASSYLRSDFTCEGSYNLNGYCSPEYDALVDRLASTTEPQARIELFEQAADLLARDNVGVPLVHTGAITGLRDTVDGYAADPLERSLLTSEISIRS